MLSSVTTFATKLRLTFTCIYWYNVVTGISVPLALPPASPVVCLRTARLLPCSSTCHSQHGLLRLTKTPDELNTFCDGLIHFSELTTIQGRLLLFIFK